MIIEVGTGRPGTYVAVVCDEPDCFGEGRPATNDRIAIRRALEDGFVFDALGNATCHHCAGARRVA